MSGYLASLWKPKGKYEKEEVSATGKNPLVEKWASNQEGLESLAFYLLSYIKNHMPGRHFWGCAEEVV